MDSFLDVLFSTEVLIGLSVFSVITFLGSLIVIPIILVKLPPHYFDDRYPRKWWEHHHPLLRSLWLTVKNAGGFVLIMAGIVMLFLPGQGILTILVGVSLMDIPGKRYLERRLISRPMVLRTINKLRENFNKPPLAVSPDL